MTSNTLHIESDEAMQALGAKLANACQSHGVIYLKGELGTGIAQGQGRIGCSHETTGPLQDNHATASSTNSVDCVLDGGDVDRGVAYTLNHNALAASERLASAKVTVKHPG